MYCYAKTTHSISFKLTAFNKYTYSCLYMNFLRDQTSFNGDINLYNID